LRENEEEREELGACEKESGTTFGFCARDRLVAEKSQTQHIMT
jgi:hypothetical protein